jgi:hypothetical protein
MTKKSRMLKNITAIIFLTGFLISQTVVFSHNYYSSFQNHSSKHGNSASITEKCQICELQSHNNLLFESQDLPVFTSVVFDTPCVYTQSYSGIKLIISSSRAPPVV